MLSPLGLVFDIMPNNDCDSAVARRFGFGLEDLPPFWTFEVVRGLITGSFLLCINAAIVADRTYDAQWKYLYSDSPTCAVEWRHLEIALSATIAVVLCSRLRYVTCVFCCVLVLVTHTLGVLMYVLTAIIAPPDAGLQLQLHGMNAQCVHFT